MSAEEINVLAVAVAKAVRENMCDREIDEFMTLLGQILCNLSTYHKCK